MKKFDFMIAYDVACEKRLRKLAKLLEEEALRVQFSLFLYPNQSQQALTLLSEKIVDLIDEKEDDVRIYRIDIKRSLHLASAVDLCYPTIYREKVES